MSQSDACTHIGAVSGIKHAKKHVCDECIKIGGQWVHLRTCQECGGTHCCDNSPNRHATKHAKATSHPVSVRGILGRVCIDHVRRFC